MAPKYEGEEIPAMGDTRHGRAGVIVGRHPHVRYFYRWPTVSGDDAAQLRYEAMRRAGQSHNLAEILATRSFPGVRTDATFNAGRVNGNQFEKTPGLGDRFRQVAEAAGVSTTGKYYSHGLAEYPGDPEAWVADRHDVLEVARKKGMHVRGAVEYHPPEHAPAPDVAIADDLVAREVDEIMARDAGYRREDVEQEVRLYRSGAVDLGDPLAGEVA